MVSLVCLVVFSVLDVFWPQPHVIVALCIVLVGAHVLRLLGWHTPGIWKKPLLWILFTGYLFLILGFVFKIWAVLGHRPDDAALHAWTAGGIGIFTLGMMARVAWGHTGRNIGEPPGSIVWMFMAMIASAVFRVFLPILYEPYYMTWIVVSQFFWMLAFGMYLFSYCPVLIAPRPDGKWG